MPDLKPGEPVRVQGDFVKEQDGFVAVRFSSSVGHLWFRPHEVAPAMDVSELVEALKALLDEWRSPDCKCPLCGSMRRARAALAKFEAAQR